MMCPAEDKNYPNEDNTDRLQGAECAEHSPVCVSIVHSIEGLAYMSTEILLIGFPIVAVVRNSADNEGAIVSG